VWFVLIIVFLYLNTPENCVSNCMFYFHK
jgi:hypothetical protein